VRFDGAERLDGFGHGTYMGGGCAAAAAEDADAGFGSFAGEERKIFWRRFGIDDAVAFAFGETGVGHPADPQIVDGSELLKNWEKRLRAEGAVGADDLNVLISELSGGLRGSEIAIGGAVLGVSERGNNGQAGEGANGVHGEKNFFDVGESFEDEEIHAAFFKGLRLFAENFENFLRLGVTGLDAETERADGAGDEDFAGGGFASFARDFNAARVEALHFICQAERSELEAIGAEGVSLNDVSAGFDVGLVDTEDGFGLGGVEFVETSLRTNRFVKERAHGAVGDEDGVFEAFVEVENFHWEMGRVVCLLFYTLTRRF
jgi:hypothetical protein